MSSVVTTPAQDLKLSILEELHRACDAGLEGASDRQRNLLSYLVTEELEGRGERLKAYSIATEVLGRPDDFDPQQDSIVRVEIGRLRQALERYYLMDGKNASVVISIPKGQYRPVFMRAQIDPPPPPEAATPPTRRFGRHAMLAALVMLAAGLLAAVFWKFAAGPAPRQTASLARRGPVVAIAPFDFHADREGQSYIGGGLQADLADILSEYQWLTVIPLTDENGAGPGGDSIATPDFVVRGSLRLVGDQLKATVLLLDGRTGAVRWTNRYELSLRAGEVLAMQSDLVRNIGRDVGNPFGIVADIALAQRTRNEKLSDEALTCQLRAFHYWKTFKSQDYGPAWRCLEAVKARGAVDANTLAIASLLSFDAHNARYADRSREEARAEAAATAARAYELDSSEFIPRVARYSAAICTGDIDGFRQVAHETVERFPNNPLALADIGSRFILGSGDYAEGAALIERARAIAPDLTPLDTVAIAVDALRRGEYADRPRLRRAAARTDSAVVLIVEMALAAARGDVEETTKMRRRLSDLGFEDEKSIAEALDTTCWSRSIRDLVKSRAVAAFRNARGE